MGSPLPIQRELCRPVALDRHAARTRNSLLGMRIAGKAFEAFVEDVVMLEFAPGNEVLARATGRWVGKRVLDAAAVVRGGLLVPAAVLDLAALARYGRPYAGLVQGQRLRMARRLLRTGTPLVGDWVRTVRLLAVAYVYERRFG